jgi:hypothetical protein
VRFGARHPALIAGEASIEGHTLAFPRAVDMARWRSQK